MNKSLFNDASPTNLHVVTSIISTYIQLPLNSDNFSVATFNCCRNKQGVPIFFRMLPWPTPSPILVLNVVLVSNTLYPSGVKLCTCACVTTATVCFKQKSNISIAKFGNFGANGVKGSKFLVENIIFGIADPDLPIHYATFMGLR